MKVRHYGFMSSNCSVSLADIKGLIEIHFGFEKFQRSSSFWGQILFCRGNSPRPFASISPYRNFRARMPGFLNNGLNPTCHQTPD